MKILFLAAHHAYYRNFESAIAELAERVRSHTPDRRVRRRVRAEVRPARGELIERQRALAITDPHSPPKWRVNGLVANMPEFAQAFSCKPGAPLNPPKRCRVW